MLRKGWLPGLVLGGLFASTCLAEEIWLIVDTQKLQLTVKQGMKTVKVFNNIAIGRNGAGFKTHVGDDITPLGEFRIAWINNKSPYYRFFGFNYPNRHNADEGMAWGLINRATHQKIIAAHDAGKIPPQNTVLGGQIGIHGLGAADKDIHRLMNWTHGCVALTNEQIDNLSRYVKTGIRVEVK